MIKANISKGNKQQVIEASGSIKEIASDIAVMVGCIYKQFKAASPTAADAFRLCVQTLIADSSSPCWTHTGNQTGIAIQWPDKDEPHDP